MRLRGGGYEQRFEKNETGGGNGGRILCDISDCVLLMEVTELFRGGSSLYVFRGVLVYNSYIELSMERRKSVSLFSCVVVFCRASPGERLGYD